MSSYAFVFVDFFLFKEPPTTESYTNGHTLPLHDALPFSEATGMDERAGGAALEIETRDGAGEASSAPCRRRRRGRRGSASRRRGANRRRKSTRLNSSH